jgi:regulator of protease activity HflC (stomatin/prohibitin superfamily)
VLGASQDALRATAEARTAGEQAVQSANEDADHILEIAQASASERTSQAQANTADILQLSQALKSGSDPGLLERLYRQRIAAVLAQTRNLTLVNPGDDAHLIIQGAISAAGASAAAGVPNPPGASSPPAGDDDD